MKKLAFFLLSAVALTFTSCSKEDSKGSTGPAGPAGPAGDDAGFAINSLTIPAADWAAGNTYVEYTVDFINADFYETGVAIAYIQTNDGYWNAIPSQWHTITGFSYSFNDTDEDGVGDSGVVGFDAINGAPTTDLNARVVTMNSRDYEVLDSNGQINNYNEVMTYLSKN
jgi:hypothetical protein